MVERLVGGPTLVSGLARPLPMSLPAVMQHLAVRDGAGLVITAKTGRTRSCRIDPAAVAPARSWIDARHAGRRRQLPYRHRTGRGPEWPRRCRIARARHRVSAGPVGRIARRLTGPARARCAQRRLECWRTGLFGRLSPRYFGHSPGNFNASHRASPALTSTGFSCAIQWPDCTTISDRSAQSARIGSARRDTIVSQVVS